MGNGENPRAAPPSTSTDSERSIAGLLACLYLNACFCQLCRTALTSPSRRSHNTFSHHAYFSWRARAEREKWYMLVHKGSLFASSPPRLSRQGRQVLLEALHKAGEVVGRDVEVVQPLVLVVDEERHQVDRTLEGGRSGRSVAGGGEQRWVAGGGSPGRWHTILPRWHGRVRGPPRTRRRRNRLVPSRSSRAARRSPACR